jgi:ATP-binding cassette subfamily A (ABC1) protein 3
MATCSQFSALFKKNMILMKRNIFSSCCLILFPIFLFVCIALIRKALTKDQIEQKGNDTEVLRALSSIYPTNEANNLQNAFTNQKYSGLSVFPPFFICNDQNLTTVGVINGSKNLNDKVKLRVTSVQSNLTFKEFESQEKLFDYVVDPNYGVSTNKLCFGFGIAQVSEKEFNYTLNYYSPLDKGKRNDQEDFYIDIPSTLLDPLSPFASSPMTDEYEIWQISGYIYMMNSINNVILEETTKNSDFSTTPRMTAGIVPMKFPVYDKDDFVDVLAFVAPFFLVVIYMIPLIVFVFRMVKDKETRVKEGMKIMGMTNLAFFLSYFVQYLIINIFYAIVGSIILRDALESVMFGIKFAFLFMYGLSIFGLIYIFQATIEKSTMAIILSIMIYYIMYFISPVVVGQNISNSSKMGASLLSPTALQLGFITIAKFVTSKMELDTSNLNYQYFNYSVNNMFLMFFIDFLIYMFLGFYLENVLPHEFGTKRPLNFLFTKKYWFDGEKAQVNSEDKNENFKNDNINFQDESNYTSKLNENEYLRIRNIEKVFDDGKKALNGVSFNLYKDEIFALLGHNGAGKSTLINILSGLYESSNGTVLYEGQNMLKNLDVFRKKIGICPQHDVLFQDLTVKEHLYLFANFKGVKTDNLETEITKILSDLELTSKCEDLSQNLSGGQKRKLSIAIALIGGSEIIFLDEPSSGMDITNRRKLWDVLKKFTRNRIIILTTHYMEEASVLGKRIGIMSGGKMKCSGTPLFLINKFGKNISLTLVKNHVNKNENIDKINSTIVDYIRDSFKQYSENSSGMKLEIDILTEEILIKIPKNQDSYKLKYMQFFEDLDKNLERLELRTYSAAMPTLEDVFLLISDEIKFGNKTENIGLNKKEDGNSSNEEHDVKARLTDGYKRYDEYDATKVVIPTGCSKFILNLKWCLLKRYYQTLRNIRIFILEVVCPILIVLIGLGISSVEFVNDPPNREITLNNYAFKQKAIVSSFSYYSQDIEISKNFKTTNDRMTYQYSNIKLQPSNFTDSIIDFRNNVFNTLNSTQVSNPTFNNSQTGSSLSSFFFIEFNEKSHIYEFLTLADIKSSDSPPAFTQLMFTDLINFINKKKDIKINVS